MPNPWCEADERAMLDHHIHIPIHKKKQIDTNVVEYGEFHMFSLSIIQFTMLKTVCSSITWDLYKTTVL